jgi:hypothetical protein
MWQEAAHKVQIQIGDKFMHLEIDDHLIDVYISRFINQPDEWFRQWVSDDKKSYGYVREDACRDTEGGRYVYQSVTPQLIRRHLAGQLTCAWTALDEDKCSKWLCFDSDVADGQLDRLESCLREWLANPIREGRRPGRDGHLWLLFDQPVKASQLITLGDAMMKEAGVANLERFPKSASGFSQVRGPLGINLKPEANGARGWFDGAEQDLREQLLWLEGQPLNTAKSAIECAELHKRRPTPTKKYAGQRSRVKKFVNILNLIPDTKRGSDEIVMACPVCESEGHDKQGNNLHIAADGEKFCCWYGGQPGKIHTAPKIIEALKEDAARRVKS